MPSSEAEPLLVFLLEDRRFALRASIVERSLRAAEITPLPEPPPGVRGLINVAGQVVPVYDPRVKFSMATREVRTTDFFIIAKASQRTIALLVNDVIGLVETPITRTDNLIDDAGSLDGLIKLDSELVLIQNLDKFLSTEQSASLEASLQS